MKKQRISAFFAALLFTVSLGLDGIKAKCNRCGSCCRRNREHHSRITMYTGTPGSGKSFHAAQDIYSRLRRGGGLICNFPIKEELVKKRKAHVEYWDNSEMSAARLVAYALEHHKIGKEGQTLVIIDEAQIIFNCRDFGRKDRNAWVTFFSQHRKLGFNVILITQSDRMLDKQIRALIENEVKHRKLNNYGFGGMILSFLTAGMTWFIAIDYWYGGNKLMLGKTFIPYHSRTAEIYDSYKLFSDMVTEGGAVCAGGDREAMGPQGTAAPPEDDQAMKALAAARLITVLWRVLEKKAGVQSAADPSKDPRKIYWNQLMRAMARYA